jgi:hypothetical protein
VDVPTFLDSRAGAHLVSDCRDAEKSLTEGLSDTTVADDHS